MSGAGHVADMNNRVKQNRSLKPSKRARFKGNNRDTIYSDTLPSLTELTFKKVSKTELRKIKEKIKNRARKDRIKEMYIFLTVALTLLTTLYFLLK
jgi:CRISPR/Cas system CSM-associated protein Csm2 small subunit